MLAKYLNSTAKLKELLEIILFGQKSRFGFQSFQFSSITRTKLDKFQQSSPTFGLENPHLFCALSKSKSEKFRILVRKEIRGHWKTDYYKT